MQVKIFIYCLIGAFLCSGCSQLRLAAQIEFPAVAKQPQSSEVGALQDSLKTKDQHVQNDSMRARTDSARVAVANDLKAESHFPNGARTKLIPFREKSNTVWTSVALGTLGGMVIGAIIGSATKPDYPSEEHVWTYMIYGTAIGCAVGTVVGVIVAADDGVLLLGEDTPEKYR
ncbi:MAG: hypothetical protein ACREOI_32310, partial [bacterium]